MRSDCRGTFILLDIEEQKTHLFSCLKQLENRRVNERAVFYIKCQAAENEFLRQGGSKVNSTIASILEIVSNTYMEGLSRQRKTVSQEERFETLDI